MRPHLVTGGRVDESPDPRVAAVMDVLSGHSAAEVAQRYAVEPALLYRWVRAFVDAGTAQVTNRPSPDAADQRDRFLAAFAHEVRTPLTVAQGWVRMLLDDQLPPDQVDRSVRRIHGALKQLAERALDVELLAAASLGRLQLAPRAVTVAELVADIPGLDPDRIIGNGPDTVLTVDPVLFTRVLRDLWQAASTAPAPRSILLETASMPPWVEVRVVRDADPIEPHVLQALFEPFDLNDDGTGVTIGLYLARALTVAHGGTVGVSQDEHGAALWVRVPDHAKSRSVTRIRPDNDFPLEPA